LGRALATALLLALVSCKDKAPPAPAPAASSSPAPDPASSARRPARRYYMARTATRCEVYSADHGSVSAPVAAPCPLDLQVGERIRIAGQTCVREGGGPERVEPVVCPDPLTYLEKDGGE
jgi:hypothetical protein